MILNYFYLIAAFIGSLLLINIIMYVFKKFFSSEAQNLSKNIRKIQLERSGSSLQKNSLLKNYVNSDPFSIYIKNKNWKFIEKIETIIVRAGLTISLKNLFLIASILFITAVILSNIFFNFTLLTSFVISILVLMLCIFYLKRIGLIRLNNFNRQLPEVLDSLGRSLRSGSSLNSSIALIASDFSEPVSTEFRQVFEEIQFGLDFNDSMNNLAYRNPSDELNFFITSLIIQKESGGNLSELISGISKTMRDRIKLEGKVRALSAEGRISAIILSALPVLIGIIFFIINPDYLSLLWTTDKGSLFMKCAVIFIFIGYFWAKKLARIEM